MGLRPEVVLAAERLYRESMLGISDPREVARRDGDARRDLERLTVATLRAFPAVANDLAESLLAGAAEASEGEIRHVDALAAYRTRQRRTMPSGLRRFLDLAGRTSRWGDAYALAILPDGRGPAIFRIVVQVELDEGKGRRRAEHPRFEVDDGFGLGAAKDATLRSHVADAATAAFDFLRTSAPGRPIADFERASVVRVFRGGMPWPFTPDSYLPTAFEREQAVTLQAGGSMGLAVALAVLDAFLPGWTTWQGPICAATGELTAHGSVEAVGEVAAKAGAAADAGLRFVFPRRGTQSTVESRYRQVAVETLGGAAAEAFNLAGADVEAFLAKSPPVLYGRDEELAALGAAWARVRGGRRRLALVHGGSGIGKSGLVASELRRLLGEGIPVVFGRAEQFMPQVLAPIVDRLVGGLRADELRAHAEEYGAWLGSVVQELRRFLPDHFGAPLGQDSPEKLSVAICALIRYCADRLGGLVLVIDDLQWGKEETWPVLLQLLHQERPAPVLVIATYRGDAEGASRDAEPALAGLRAAGLLEEIPVEGLTAEVLRRWLEAVIGERAGDVIEAIREVTAGNPLQVANHLEELLGRLSDSSPAAAEELVAAVYAAGRQVITQRLRAFAGLRTLKLAATVRSAEFSAQLLQEAGVLPADVILRDLVEARESGFIRVVRAGRYTFVHQMTRQAVRALVPPEQAATDEVALARALERRSQEPGAKAPVAELARHLDAAAPFIPDVWAQASEYAGQAAEEATRRFAYDTVLEFRQMALRTFDLGEVEIPERRCRLLLALARALSYVGREDEARSHFRDARDLAEAEGLHDLVIEATLGFAGPPEDRGVTDDEMLRFLEEADRLPTDPGDDRRLRLRGRSTFEGVLAARREPEAFTMPPVVDILRDARASGDPIELTWALLSRLMGHWVHGEHTTARLALAEEMLARSEKHGERDIAAWAHAFRVIHLLELGRRDDAEHVVEELAVLGRQLHYGYARWGAAVLRPVFAHLDGRFAESRQLAETAFHERRTALNSVLYLYIQNMLALREEGQLAQVERQLSLLSGRMQETVFEGAPAVVVRTAWALLRCELGDAAGARRELDRLIDAGAPGPLDDPAWTTGLALLAETCAYVQDTRVVPTLYEVLKVREGECVIVALAVACLGAVDRYLGILSGVLGQWDVATGHFEAAIVMNRDRMRSPVWTAHTEADYAALLVRRGRSQDAGDARRLALSAAATAARLGMPGVEQQAAGLLKTLG